MTADGLRWMPAWQLVALMRSGKLSPVEVVDEFLGVIERLEPRVNAFLHLAPEEARAAARRAADEISRGTSVGPLHGLPVGVKDNIHVEGMPTTSGSLLFRDFIPSADSITAERLRRAGAIIVGKTHMPEFASFPRTTNRLLGDCRNPWDLTRVVGASSGGSGAAAAAGMVPVAIGTDGGGSTRIPAALCGVTGIQPTRGFVPAWGRIGAGRFSGIGPMCYSVADSALVMSVISGRDDRDPKSAPFDPYRFEPSRFENESTADISGLRCGWVSSFNEHRPDPVVTAVVEVAVRSLDEHGVRIVPTDFRVDRLWEMLGMLVPSTDTEPLNPESHLAMPEVVAAAADPSREELLTPNTVAVAKMYRPPSVELYEQFEALRRDAMSTVDALFDDVDVIATPTMPVVAPPVPDDPWANPFTSTEYYTSLTSLANLCEIPAMTVPCGFIDGLPVGLQLMGRRGTEAALYRLSHHIETINPWLDRPQILNVQKGGRYVDRVHSGSRQ